MTIRTVTSSVSSLNECICLHLGHPSCPPGATLKKPLRMSEFFFLLNIFLLIRIYRRYKGGAFFFFFFFTKICKKRSSSLPFLVYTVNQQETTLV